MDKWCYFSIINCHLEIINDPSALRPSDIRSGSERDNEDGEAGKQAPRIAYAGAGERAWAPAPFQARGDFLRAICPALNSTGSLRLSFSSLSSTRTRSLPDMRASKIAS